MKKALTFDIGGTKIYSAVIDETGEFVSQIDKFSTPKTLDEIKNLLRYQIQKHEEEIDVVVALEAMQEPLSIYTPIYNNGSDEIYLIDQIGDDDDPENKKVLKMTIEQGLSRLNQRERDIINKRYFQDLTQMEIAEEIGISQAQVSRLEKSALKSIFSDYI